MADVVIDASAAVRLLIEPQAVARSHTLFAETAVHTVAHFDAECLSGLRNLWLRSNITEDQFLGFGHAVSRLPFIRVDTGLLHERILELRHNATPYDAAYVALAEILDAPLLTDDLRIPSIPGIRCEVIQFS